MQACQCERLVLYRMASELAITSADARSGHSATREQTFKRRHFSISVKAWDIELASRVHVLFASPKKSCKTTRHSHGPSTMRLC